VPGFHTPRHFSPPVLPKPPLPREGHLVITPSERRFSLFSSLPPGSYYCPPFPFKTRVVCLNLSPLARPSSCPASYLISPINQGMCRFFFGFCIFPVFFTLPVLHLLKTLQKVSNDPLIPPRAGKSGRRIRRSRFLSQIAKPPSHM